MNRARQSVSSAISKLQGLGYLEKCASGLVCTLPEVSEKLTQPSEKLTSSESNEVSEKLTEVSEKLTPVLKNLTPTEEAGVSEKLTSVLKNLTPTVQDVCSQTVRKTNESVRKTNSEVKNSDGSVKKSDTLAGARASLSLNTNTNTNTSTGFQRESAGAGAREEESQEAGSFLNALGIADHRGTPLPKPATSLPTSEPFHNDPDDLADSRGTTPVSSDQTGHLALDLFSQKAGRVPPMYHAELIRTRVNDLQVWEATLETWEMLGYRWIVPSVLERYTADVNAIHGSGASKKPALAQGTTPQDAEDARLEALYGHLF